MTTRADLLELLANLGIRGRVAPCLSHHDAACWTSEDLAAQTRAAALCAASCPALVPCEEYGRTHLREFGVYGAQTDRDRHPRPVRPTTKDATA
jgi:hypothetical protein